MKLLATICFLLVFFASTFSQNKNEDYKNPKIAVEKRVKDLLSRMTLEEKIAQLSMKSLGKLKMDKDGNVTDSSLVVVFGGQCLLYSQMKKSAMPISLTFLQRLYLIF